MSSDEEIIVKADNKEKKIKRKREEDGGSSKKLSKEDRKKLKAEKKAEKEEALANVPKVDEDGLAYTKIQIKRMVKRVKRGLDPVPTEEEERERNRELRLEEREAEDELADMLYKKDDKENEDEDNADEDDNDNADEGDNAEEDMDENMDDDDEEEVQPVQQSRKHDVHPPVKKKARSKTVPADYVCSACKNAETPLHWIYDCPNKIRQPGTNQIKRTLRGVHDPSSRKVFLSGLPFEAKGKEIENYFEKAMKCGKVVHCKLLTFDDTKRCKGNGFVTFETDEGARNALKLNGTIFPYDEEPKKGDKKGADKAIKKELKLGVRKVLNRTLTRKPTHKKR